MIIEPIKSWPTAGASTSWTIAVRKAMALGVKEPAAGYGEPKTDRDVRRALADLLHRGNRGDEPG